LRRYRMLLRSLPSIPTNHHLSHVASHVTTHVCSRCCMGKLTCTFQNTRALVKSCQQQSYNNTLRPSKVHIQSVDRMTKPIQSQNNKAGYTMFSTLPLSKYTYAPKARSKCVNFPHLARRDNDFSEFENVKNFQQNCDVAL
jgi:hypothetical protein